MRIELRDGFGKDFLSGGNTSTRNLNGSSVNASMTYSRRSLHNWIHSECFEEAGVGAHRATLLSWQDFPPPRQHLDQKSC